MNVTKHKFFVVLLLTQVGLVSAESLKPLSSFVTEAPPDAARTSYLMARCSALYMGIQIITEASNPQLSKKFEIFGQAAFLKYISLSELAIKQNNPNYKTTDVVTDKALQTVRNISSMYKPLLENSYSATGSYLSSPVVMGDLQVCQQILNAK